MEASGEDFACIIQNYNNLLNHHDLSCKAVDKVVSSLNFTDGSLDDFDATKVLYFQCNFREIFIFILTLTVSSLCTLKVKSQF